MKSKLQNILNNLFFQIYRLHLVLRLICNYEKAGCTKGIIYYSAYRVFLGYS